MADTEQFDPQAAAQRLMSMTGLEAMQLLVKGQHGAPSIAKTLGFTLAEVEEGKAVFIGEPSDRVLNPLGIVHGGFALTLIDSCTGCAAHTTLPAGVGYTTIETKVNFVRAITPATGPVRAEGRVVARGRTIITAEGTLTDSKGKLLAHGTSTLMVLRPEARG
ncbi:PaaI family thioesterase [Vitreimonas sp.]|uniref:PaaI family thioesterase n=1 Tax=Vitreimonas sp. TaxID=3069702 RepID=UPI002ED9C7E9